MKKRAKADDDLSDLLVQFLPGHPHAGEYGVPTGNATQVGNSKMWEFELKGCQHGVERCFASQGQAWLVPADRRPTLPT